MIGVFTGIGAEEPRIYAIGQVVQWTSGLPVGRWVWAAGRMLERPSGGGTAGVVRWLARARQAVHPFTPSPPPAPPPPAVPPAPRSLYVHAGYSRIHTYAWIHRGSLSSSLLSCRPSPILSSPSVSRGFPLLSYRPVVSALDPNASAALTKLPVFVLREIAGVTVSPM